MPTAHSDRDLRGMELHDRTTRGGVLSDEERAYLEQWHAERDAEEHAILSRAATNLGELREQVNAAMARVRIAEARIGALTLQNEVLRREIAALKRRLADRGA